MNKLIRITTIASSLRTLLKGQLHYLNAHFEVIAVSSNFTDLLKVKKQEHIDVYPIEMRREISIWADLKSLFNLIKYFRRVRPYIVHANTPKASLLSMIAAKLTGVPHRVYTVTGLRFETTSGLFRKLLIAMERITCACATRVIPEGEGVKNTLIREQITKKPLEVIHYGNINGIDTTYFSADSISESKDELRLSHYIQSSDFVFIFVGRMVGDKGINELVEAFKQLHKTHSSAKLLLVGPIEAELDPLRNETIQEIENNRNIIAVGYQNDVRPFFKMADALVFPSYREGFPNVVMQAGAMGLPSIVSDINGCNEIIINKENGLIIPKKNVTELHDAMKLFLDDSELLTILTENSRKLIQSRYEQKEVWQAILKMYQSLEDK